MDTEKLDKALHDLQIAIILSIGDDDPDIISAPTQALIDLMNEAIDMKAELDELKKEMIILTSEEIEQIILEHQPGSVDRGAYLTAITCQCGAELRVSQSGRADTQDFIDEKRRIVSHQAEEIADEFVRKNQE